MASKDSSGGKLLNGKLLAPATPAADSNHKKATPPKLGEAFAPQWQGVDRSYATMPGGGIIQFDLSRLTLSDFRMMRDHYQINASLSVLTFMMHQLDWRIECDNAKIKKHCEDNMRVMWTRLVRALSQAFWAGYSPSVLQWENDLAGKTIQLTKIKDLVPEDCEINWKTIDGWAPPGKPKPGIKVYDGIKQYGAGWPIPPENTLWYPLLMENGDWYGRKLLRPAFSSWFFSIIIHLFSNRYFERFGEPLPVGRAPYDETMQVNGKSVQGTEVMLGILQNLRSRGSVVLPNERSGTPGHEEYDYTLEYLESQMRGADFERYLTRLDEEISLSLFTPLLMLRTADVGSYNLGTTHAQVYMQMLNAMAGDWAEYIDGYILNRMVDINFSPTSPRARIVFRKLGDDKIEMVKSMLQQMLASNTVKPDLVELGDIAGLTLTEVKGVTQGDPADKPAEDPEGDPAGDPADEGDTAGGETQSARKIATAMHRRIQAQITKANQNGTLGNGFVADLGYRRQLVDALVAEHKVSRDAAEATYARMAGYVGDVIGAPASAFGNAEGRSLAVQRGLELAIKKS
jgi:hypothetical protein